MRTTKAAQRTGVNEAASDTKGNDIASCNDNSEVDTNDDTDNNETTTTTMSLLQRVSRKRHNNQIDHVERGG